MRLMVEVGKQTHEEHVKVEKRLKTKKVSHLKRIGKHRRRMDMLRVLYWKRKYDKRFMFEEPRFIEICYELNTPAKLFAFCSSYFTVREDPHQPREVRNVNEIMIARNITQKELVYFMCSVMHKNKLRVHWFVIGYVNGNMLPVCAVIQNYVTITLSTVYKVHIGDQGDIMRDYYPDGNSWKVMSWDGRKVLMSYIEGRSEYGDPDLMIYDEHYWDKNQPLVTSLMKQMKLFNNGAYGEGKY